MNQYKHNIRELYNATDKGLAIIHKYCEQSVGMENGKNKKFRFRDTDKTPSANLYFDQEKDYWRLHDFGFKNFTPISLVEFLTGQDFYETLQMLYAEFNVATNKPYYQPNLDFKANKNKPKNYFSIKAKKEIENAGVYGRFVTADLMQEFNVFELESYQKVTQSNKLMTTHSTERYPIFAYSNNLAKWAKLYQPAEFKRKDKNGKYQNYKHSYLGSLDNDYIHGLDRILAEVNETEINLILTEIKETSSEREKKELCKDLERAQVPNIILCTGASDGLNVASLSDDFYPIWLNSEGAILSYKQYMRITKLCKNFYNLPDIDNAGLRYASKVANTYWNMKTIFLPKENMGLNGKDFRDWLKTFSDLDKDTILVKFKILMRGASVCNFFKKQKNSNPTIEIDDLHYFLNMNGYFRYYDKNIVNEENIDTSKIVKIENNIVSTPSDIEIKDFAKRYVRLRNGEKAKISLIKKTPYFKLESLKGMDKKEIDFTNYTKKTQKYFFKNGFVEASDKKIKFTSYKQNEKDLADVFIWKNKVNKRPFFLDNEKYFEYYKDENGKNRVKIHTTKCEFMSYFINASRVFWQKELSEKDQRNVKKTFNLNSENLEPKENLIQEHHFLNKIWAMGYLCHSYKIESLAYFVYIIDDAIKESNSDADGGTGKSFAIRGLREFLKIHTEDGKKAISTDNHFLAGVDSSYDLVYLEDLDGKGSLNRIYNFVTNDMQINPKAKQRYDIRFADSPKLVGTFNYMLDDGKGSTYRRLFYVSFGNYYHSAKRGGFKQNYKISDDFGGDLFSGRWTKDNWNYFYNFLLQCVQFYLQHQKTPFYAPMENIKRNSLMAQIGDIFVGWADEFFADDLKFNTKIPKDDVIDDYRLKNSSKISSQKFSIKLSLYCEMKGYDFNPEEMQGKNSRGQIRLTTNGSTKNCYYIGKKQTEKEDDFSPF